MSLSDVPRSVAVLRDALVAAGFEETRTTSPECFGNQILEFTSADLAVRAVDDRGDWSVELSLDRDIGWFLAQLWQQCLDGTDADPYAESVDNAVAFVTSRLEHLQAVTADESCRSRLIDCLLRARAARGSAIRNAIFGDAEPGDR
jgi:hypothetical protein